VSYSLTTIWHERQRFLPAILAVAFSAVLVTVQTGLVLGLISMMSIPVDKAAADVWVSYPGIPSVDLGRPIPERWLVRLAAHPEVERAEESRLRLELLRLRANSLSTAGAASGAGGGLTGPSGSAFSQRLIASLTSGYWHFADGGTVTLVCAQVPAEMRELIPYSDPADPDYVALYAYADLDAFIELHGHVRAANPGNHVFFRTADRLESDDYSTHLVSLGGVDWNHATASLLGKLSLPVIQVGDWSSDEGPYFEVGGDGRPRRLHPVLTTAGDRRSLREDVAMFARSVNPFNSERTATICNGMYASGTLGAARALTDANFRDRNTDYLRTRFGRSQSFCIVTKVAIEQGKPVTPDWTKPENRLYEWASEAS